MQDLPPIPKMWEPSAELRWVEQATPRVLRPRRLQQKWIEIEFHTHMVTVQGLSQLVKQPTGVTEWRDVPTVPEGS